MQDAQLRALLPDLQRCAGSHGLMIAAAGGAPPPLPLLAYWANLQTEGTFYAGDLIGATNEPLPFNDDAFDLVWLRHALEVLPQSAQVLREAVRVLAPGGALVITGLHPLSTWSPWFYWATRGASYRLHSPLQLAHVLRRAGLDVTGTRRVGHAWPTAGSGQRTGQGLLGGGYVLMARKRQFLITPLRLRTAALRTSGNRSLSPSTGARRSASA